MKETWFTCPRCWHQFKAAANHNHHCPRCNRYPVLAGKQKPVPHPTVPLRSPTPSGQFPQYSGPLPPYAQPTQPGWPPSMPPPMQPPAHQRALANFQRLSKRNKIIVGCGTLGLVFILLCVCIGAAASGGNNNTASATTTPGSVAQGIHATATPKVIGSPTPTRTPKPTATLKPTATATPKPSPTPFLAIQFTCAEGIDYSYAKVCVQTSPGAQLNIVVTYCSGKSATSASLKGTKAANDAGYYEWDWTPDTNCRGSVDVSIVGSLDSLFGAASTSFNLG